MNFLSITNQYYQKMSKIPKILLVSDDMAEAGWNKHLPVPLKIDEKVIVSSDQENVEKGFIRVKHGDKDAKTESVFSLHDFTTLQGEKLG